MHIETYIQFDEKLTKVTTIFTYYKSKINLFIGCYCFVFLLKVSILDKII